MESLTALLACQGRGAACTVACGVSFFFNRLASLNNRLAVFLIIVGVVLLTLGCFFSCVELQQPCAVAFADCSLRLLYIAATKTSHADLSIQGVLPCTAAVYSSSTACYTTQDRQALADCCVWCFFGRMNFLRCFATSMDLH